MQKSKCLLLSLSMVFSTYSFAVDVYTWKDEKGFTHFGDKKNSPEKSKVITIHSSNSSDAPAKIIVLPASKTVIEADSEQRSAPDFPSPIELFTGLTAEKITECASYAREMVGANKNKWLMQASKIKAECPKTGFECITFYRHPEKNKCEPFPLADAVSGVFFRDVKRDFPSSPKS
jgi:hypothetical protein